MKRFVLLVAALALAQSLNLRAFLAEEMLEIEKELGIAVEPLRDDVKPEKCDASGDYAFEIDTLDISPYPIKLGDKTEINYKLTALKDFDIDDIDLQVKVLGFTVYSKDIPLPQDTPFTKGMTLANDTFVDLPSESIPVKSFDLYVHGYDKNKNEIACFKRNVQLAATQELEQLRSSPSFSKCTSGANYEVEIESMDFSPYPIKKDADLNVKVTGKSTSGDVVVSEFKISALGATVLDKKMTVDCASGATCEIDDTEKIPYIPFVEHITAQADVYDNKGGHAACYNVKIAFA